MTNLTSIEFMQSYDTVLLFETFKFDPFKINFSDHSLRKMYKNAIQVSGGITNYLD